jgi:hypothetical protein
MPLAHFEIMLDCWHSSPAELRERLEQETGVRSENVEFKVVNWGFRVRSGVDPTVLVAVVSTVGVRAELWWQISFGSPGSGGQGKSYCRTRMDGGSKRPRICHRRKWRLSSRSSKKWSSREFR